MKHPTPLEIRLCIEEEIIERFKEYDLKYAIAAREAVIHGIRKAREAQDESAKAA